MFNDRVGLAAGRSQKPFLVQIYRRDMGGGKFALMKDVSAPITIQETPCASDQPPIEQWYLCRGGQ